MTKMRSKVMLIAGPHGVGKSYLAHRLTQQRDQITIAPGVVTRPVRDSLNDNDKQIAIEEFQRMAAAGRLCLEAEIGGNHYGYIRENIDSNIRAGKCVIILLLFAEDVLRAKALWPDALTVYLRPVDTELLRRRLIARNGAEHDRIDQLISEGMRAVGLLDHLDWALQVDVSEGTDAAAKVNDYLKTIP